LYSVENSPETYTMTSTILLTLHLINYTQYWCIDGKYRIYVARLRNGGKMSFSEYVYPFRAVPHKFYIIKINRIEEGHNSYPLVCRRPAETVSFQRRHICYRWGTPAYWSLVPRSSMFYLFEYCLKNMWNCSLIQQILSHSYNISLRKETKFCLF
jgi:hypothetical protein